MSQGIRAYESEHTQLFGKLSSEGHGLAPTPGCGWGPVKGGQELAPSGRCPAPEGCPQNAAGVHPGDAFQTWHRPAYSECSVAGPQICSLPGGMQIATGDRWGQVTRTQALGCCGGWRKRRGSLGRVASTACRSAPSRWMRPSSTATTCSPLSSSLRLC